jgi:hypothetical protein
MQPNEFNRQGSLFVITEYDGEIIWISPCTNAEEAVTAMTEKIVHIAKVAANDVLHQVSSFASVTGISVNSTQVKQEVVRAFDNETSIKIRARHGVYTYRFHINT